jgi:hypothetical protein
MSNIEDDHSICAFSIATISIALTPLQGCEAGFQQPLGLCFHGRSPFRLGALNFAEIAVGDA